MGGRECEWGDRAEGREGKEGDREGKREGKEAHAPLPYPCACAPLAVVHVLRLTDPRELVASTLEATSCCNACLWWQWRKLLSLVLLCIIMLGHTLHEADTPKMDFEPSCHRA